MPKRDDYIKGINGSQIDIELPCNFHLACCSCGLDHLFILELPTKDKLRMTVYRDDDRTIMLRRQSRYECRPKVKKRAGLKRK